MRQQTEQTVINSSHMPIYSIQSIGTWGCCVITTGTDTPIPAFSVYLLIHYHYDGVYEQHPA